jgi:hypothetical protein
LRGEILPAQVTWTGPWSMQGRLLPDNTLTPAPLELISIGT